MIRTTIIAGGLLGLGIFTAAPAMAGPGMDANCSPTPFCSVRTAAAPDPIGLFDYYTGTGPGTARGDFTTAWTTGPATAINVWATGPATVAKVWHDALSP